MITPWIFMFLLQNTLEKDVDDTTTISYANVPLQVYADLHCRMLKTCHRPGKVEPVCAVEQKEHYMAQFDEVCTFHDYNCKKYGMFVLNHIKRCSLLTTIILRNFTEVTWPLLPGATIGREKETKDFEWTKTFEKLFHHVSQRILDTIFD